MNNFRDTKTFGEANLKVRKWNTIEILICEREVSVLVNQRVVMKFENQGIKIADMVTGQFTIGGHSDEIKKEAHKAKNLLKGLIKDVKISLSGEDKTS